MGGRWRELQRIGMPLADSRLSLEASTAASSTQLGARAVGGLADLARPQRPTRVWFARLRVLLSGSTKRADNLCAGGWQAAHSAPAATDLAWAGAEGERRLRSRHQKAELARILRSQAGTSGFSTGARASME